MTSNGFILDFFTNFNQLYRAKISKDEVKH